MSARGNRTILFDKIDGIRRLTTGKQLLRTVTQVLGLTLYGLGFEYINDNIWKATIVWVGGLSIISLAPEDFNTKYERDWQIRIVRE